MTQQFRLVCLTVSFLLQGETLYQIRVVKHYCRYDILKYSFTQRVNLWNSLLLYVVNPYSVNSFKTNIDKLWCIQDVYYSYKCDIAGTGNRSVSNK